MAKDIEAKEFECLIVSPDKVLFEGTITNLTVPGMSQELSILPDHTPLYAQLAKGTIVLLPVNQPTLSIPIESGIIRMRANRASIITGFDIRGDVLGSEKMSS